MKYIKQFIAWMKAPFYKVEGTEDLDGILIVLMAFLFILFVIAWKTLIMP